MEFNTSLKSRAQRIIELSNDFGERVHTWNQEEFAPASGYEDRAGFIVYDDIELFADVYAPDDETTSLLRSRLAWSPKDSPDQNVFTIITLDFNANRVKTKALVDKANDLTREDLITLLQDTDTTPKLIHVSLEAGRDADGKATGTRYENDSETAQSLSPEQQADFLNTLDQAFALITSKK